MNELPADYVNGAYAQRKKFVKADRAPHRTCGLHGCCHTRPQKPALRRMQSATIKKICEACERAGVEVIEPCDDALEPYHLCVACHGRLLARALRPLEWFNLAKRHSWRQYLLHDDFYDQDGSAAQPETDLDYVEELPAPILADVGHDPELLLGYSITQWHLKPEDEAAWTALPRPQVLETLRQRFNATSHPQIRRRVLEICAIALHESGADFVCAAWEHYPETAPLDSLARASASCLPFREGFDRVTASLALLTGSGLRDQMWALAYFRSAEVLDWIERNVFPPIMENWGRLAAVSHLDWLRVEQWLERGRPLSLVALDALVEIADPRTPFTCRYRPKLEQLPTFERLADVLNRYTERDAVPRVQQRTKWLISQADVILRPI